MKRDEDLAPIERAQRLAEGLFRFSKRVADASLAVRNAKPYDAVMGAHLDAALDALTIAQNGLDRAARLTP